VYHLNIIAGVWTIPVLAGSLGCTVLFLSQNN